MITAGSKVRLLKDFDQLKPGAVGVVTEEHLDGLGRQVAVVVQFENYPWKSGFTNMTIKRFLKNITPKGAK